MPEPYSDKTRLRVYQAWLDGCNLKELVDKFPRQGRSTLHRWMWDFDLKASHKRSNKGKQSGVLRGASDPAVLPALREILGSECRLFHDEIALALLERYDLVVSHATINRTIHATKENGGLGFSHLKTTRIARQRVLKERFEFISTVERLRGWGVKPAQWIVLDECHKSRSELLRSRGYGEKGQPLQQTEYFSDGESFSLIAVAGVDGFHHQACMITSDSVDSEMFTLWAKECLVPLLGNFAKMEPNSIVILDNVCSLLRADPSAPCFFGPVGLVSCIWWSDIRSCAGCPALVAVCHRRHR
jgi:hypothetical protein